MALFLDDVTLMCCDDIVLLTVTALPGSIVTIVVLTIACPNVPHLFKS